MSADGRLLAFGTFDEDEDVELPLIDLHILDVETGAVRTVAEHVWPDVRWSPVGPELLAAVVENRKWSLVVVDRSGRARTIANTAPAVSGAWAPKGDRIAFGDETGLWVVRADGRELRRLAAPATGIAWAPSGRRLAFFTSRASVVEADLRIADVDGGGQRRLTTIRAERSFLAWVGEDTIAFLAAPTSGEFFPGREYGVGDLYRVDLQSGRLARVARRILPLQLQGDRLLFARTHGVQGEWVFTVRTARLGSARERVLAALDEQEVNAGSVPTWQPRAAAIEPAAGRFAPRPHDGCAEALAALRDRLRE